MKRGDIYSVNWEPSVPGEPAHSRPGLLLTNSAANERLPHFMLAPLTTNVTRLYPFDVLLPLGSCGLLEVSKVQLNDLRGMNRTRLGAYLGSVPTELILEIDEKLRNHLDL
jgi:mRNA interferase MazF